VPDLPLEIRDPVIVEHCQLHRHPFDVRQLNFPSDGVVIPLVCPSDAQWDIDLFPILDVGLHCHLLRPTDSQNKYIATRRT
jgi:hypothetical protein